MKNYKTMLLAASLLTMTAATTTLSAQESKGDWANFGRYAAANKQAERHAEAVLMGNSITDGWWNADSLFFRTNHLIGRGISGQTTAEMLVRFRRDVIELQPKRVVILAGINDIACNNGVITLENTFGNIRSMAELAKANGIAVILCSVLPAYDIPWRGGMKVADKVARLNDMIHDYAQREGLPYVDYYSAMKDERGGLPARLSGDGVHPTKEGYAIMENLLLKTIGER